MMDEEGFVYFRQRLKRMIVTSGYNVYPSQNILENILDGHELKPGYVHLSCVIGVKDPIKMQRHGPVQQYADPRASRAAPGSSWRMKRTPPPTRRKRRIHLHRRGYPPASCPR